MKKAAAALLAVLTLTAAAAAQMPAWTWVTYRSPDGQFSARFPATPTMTTDQWKTPAGEQLTRHVVSAEEGESAFQIGYSEILPNRTFSLPDARDGLVRAVNGTLLSETAITMGGYSGRDLIVTAEAQGKSYVMNVRIIHTPRRAYFIQTIYLSIEPYQSERTARFFSSFQITR